MFGLFTDFTIQPDKPAKWLMYHRYFQFRAGDVIANHSSTCTQLTYFLFGDSSLRILQAFTVLFLFSLSFPFSHSLSLCNIISHSLSFVNEKMYYWLLLIDYFKLRLIQAFWCKTNLWKTRAMYVCHYVRQSIYLFVWRPVWAVLCACSKLYMLAASVQLYHFVSSP